MPPKLIRVFLGGREGINVGPFMAALQIIADPASVRVESMDTDTLKKLGFSPSDLVDWLLEADAHLVLSHLHQGIISPHVGMTRCTVKWTAAILHQELTRLKDHPGFPTGDQLSCPIFLQDKLAYMRLMPDYMIPTLEVCFMEEYAEQDVSDIKNFLEQYDEGHGVYVKTTHATNGMGNIMAKSTETSEVISKIHRLKEDRGHFIDRAFIQPTLANVYEAKVVCLNKKAAYISNIGGKKGTAIPFNLSKKERDAALFSFAEECIRVLQRKCPNAILDGVVRVDIMMLKTGELVVNEFETLEACIFSKCEDKQIRTMDFIRRYWESIIERICGKIGILSAHQHVGGTILKFL